MLACFMVSYTRLGFADTGNAKGSQKCLWEEVEQQTLQMYDRSLRAIVA